MKRKMNEVKKQEILKIIREKREISIYDLQKLLPNEHKNSYGNIYYYVKELERDGLIKLEDIMRKYRTMIKIIE